MMCRPHVITTSWLAKCIAMFMEFIAGYRLRALSAIASCLEGDDHLDSESEWQRRLAQVYVHGRSGKFQHATLDDDLIRLPETTCRASAAEGGWSWDRHVPAAGVRVCC